MRSISSTLQDAQEALSHTPYTRVVIDGNDYSSRVLQIEHHEEAYRERATVVLRNNDLALSDVDLVGEYFEIGYGYTTGEGDEYSDTPGLWVKSQQFVSLPGMLICILQCEGMWALLRELRVLIAGSPPTFDVEYNKTHTIYELMELVFGSHAASFILEALGAHDDGIINAFKPYLFINRIPFENCAAILYNLIYMTKCYLRAKAGKTFQIVYPQAGDNVDESYYSDQAYYFYEYTEVMNLLVPNRINVFCNYEPTPENLITGDAVDEAAIAAYEGREILQCQLAADIDNQTDADNRASAIMTRLKAEQLAGRLLIPHDCRVELYDRVAVYDRRGE